MSKLLKSLNEKPIGFYPIYKRLTDNTNAALLLSQLMYWFSKKDKFYKTDFDITEETELTRKEIETAKIKLKKLDFLTITREGIPPKTHYSIDWEKYEYTMNLFVIEDAKKKAQRKAKRNSSPQNGEITENASDKSNNIENNTENQIGEIVVPKTGITISPKRVSLFPQNGENINDKSFETSSKTSSKKLSPYSPSLNPKKVSEREDKSFLSFVNQIRKLYKPDPDNNLYPPILQIKTSSGEKGYFKIDAKGHLYVHIPDIGIEDFSASEADHYWHYLHQMQDRLLPAPQSNQGNRYEAIVE